MILDSLCGTCAFNIVLGAPSLRTLVWAPAGRPRQALSLLVHAQPQRGKTRRDPVDRWLIVGPQRSAKKIGSRVISSRIGFVVWMQWLSVLLNSLQGPLGQV